MREEIHRPESSIGDALRKRPLMVGAALYMTGIFAHAHVPVWPMAYLGATPLLLLLAMWRRRWVASATLAAALVLAGIGAGQIEAFYYPKDHIAHFAGEEPRLARIRMRIDTPPRLLETAGPIPLPPRTVFQATVTEIETVGGWTKASGRTLVQVGEPIERLELGQRIVAFGMLDRPAPASNPGQFDWAAYYRQQRILTSLRVPHAGNVQIIASPGPGLLGWLRLRVREALGRGFGKERSLDHALLRALVVGDPDPQLRDVQDAFIRTGTSHHLAISGMHIAVLGAVVYGICRLLLLGPRLATWIGVGFVILYGSVALPSPPVVRSVLLCVAFGVGMLSRRSTDGAHLLAVSVLAMLIYHPLDLYDAGFQLSFGTVLGLMVLSGPLIRFVESKRDRDVVIALQNQPPRGWRKAREWMRRKAIEAGAAGLVAWLIASPLVAFHFSQLNSWAILASVLLAVPVFVSLVGGMFKIVLTIIAPFAAGVLATVAAWPVMAMRGCVELLEKLPGSNAPMPRPSFALLLFYYALLVLPLVPWKRPRLARLSWWALPACVLMMIGMFVWGITGMGRPRGQLELAVLSVGTGQCAVVRLPSGRVVVFDAGSDSMAGVGRNCVRPYLQHIGATSIDRLFISHANQDHFNGVVDLYQHYGIGEMHVSEVFSSQARSSRPGRELIATLRDDGKQFQPIGAGDRIALDETTTAEAFWPADGPEMDANNESLVLKLSCNGRTILFTGDIQQAAQEQLLCDPKKLKADVMVAPHHGSGEQATERLIAAVDPQVIICSNGRKLSRKQKQFDELAAGRTMYRTSRRGAIRVTIAGDGRLSVSPWR